MRSQQCIKNIFMLSYIMKGVLVIGKLIQKKKGRFREMGFRNSHTYCIVKRQAFPVRITITTAHPVCVLSLSIAYKPAYVL